MQNSEMEQRYNILRKYSSYREDSNFSETIKALLKLESVASGLPYLINSSKDCSLCHYGFQIDSYAQGCQFDCSYCWAKDHFESLGLWNRPLPIPVNLIEFWEVFFNFFEKDKKSIYYNLLKKKIPIRLGSYSDPFTPVEFRYGVTRQMIKILNHYNYPFVMLTKSDVVASDEYLSLINPCNAVVQFSFSTLDDSVAKRIEPGAPSPTRRLDAIKRLVKNGVQVTARINPLFYKEDESSLFQTNMIKKIAETGCQTILFGFASLSNSSAAGMNKEMTRDNQQNSISLTGMRSSYEALKKKCDENNVKFSTCYLGLGDVFYWKDQDLWANKADCCNILNSTKMFSKTVADLTLSERFELLSIKTPKIGGCLEFLLLFLRTYILKAVFNKTSR